MKKSTMCNPNHGCRDVQLKNTIDGFNQVISTYNRLSVCSTKSDGDQLWKELTGGITLFRRTISKLESKAFDHLSRRFETTCVVKDTAPTQKSASSASLPNNVTPVMSTLELSQHAMDNGKSTINHDLLTSPQPKYTVMKDKDGAIVVQQSTLIQASPAKPFEPQHQKRTGEAKRNPKVDGWGDPVAGSTDSERSRSPVLNKADIVDFPEPLKTSIVSAYMSRPANGDFEEDDDNYCSDTLTELAPRLPLSVPFRAGDVFNARLLCVVSPLEFYVIKESHLARLSEVETILDSVANHLLTQPLTPELCVVGGACLVLTGEHMSRATIRIAGTNELQIFLVDYGRAQFVPVSSCFAMPKCIANMAPPLAHNCSVLGADSRRLDHAALTAFNEAVMRKDEIQLRASGTSRATHGELVSIVGGARLSALPTTRPSRNQMSAGDLSSSPISNSLNSSTNNQVSRAEMHAWSNELTSNRRK